MSKLNNLAQFFSYMNDIDFNYVVLRNWDNLPYSVELGEHTDLDLLVYDLNHWLEIFPQAKREYDAPRVRFKLPIDNSYIFCDIRMPGDGYYPLDFSLAILDSKEFNDKGFYTPNPMHFRLALAYHAVHHKNANTYPRYLGNLSIKEMLQALKESSIGWVPPTDLSVGRFHPYWKGATAIVSREGGHIRKKQTGFVSYSLIDNEKRILSKINSVHFPMVIGEDGSEIIIEDCGDQLTIDNIPDNWKDQLIQIIKDLRFNKVIHRDITPNNLMIKDGVIKLIDFGWSRFEDDEDDNPPNCLGYPYKPSWGFDDSFSMRKVIKEFEFNLDEKINKTEGVSV